MPRRSDLSISLLKKVFGLTTSGKGTVPGLVITTQEFMNRQGVAFDQDGEGYYNPRAAKKQIKERNERIEARKRRKAKR